MKMDIIKILKELVNVFDALVLYQSKNLVHLDIKSDNVVCKDKCKYIDFGISSTINNILKPNSEIYKKLYDWSKRGYLLRYRPFDMLFIFDDIWSKISNLSKTDNNQFLKKEMDLYFKNICAKIEIPLEVIDAKYIKVDDQTIIKYTDLIIYNIINKFIEMNGSSGSGSGSSSKSANKLSKSLKKFILFQADVYSLGLMMVAQIRDIFQVKMYYGNLYGTTQIIIGQKKPITNTIIDHKIVIELFELCKQMMHLDPFIRLTAHEAATQYRSIIAKLD
jgi:serine/threonine protein kinase